MKTARTVLSIFLMLACSAASAQRGSIEEQTERRRRAEQNLKETTALLDGNYKNMQASEKGLKLIRNRIGAQRVIVRDLQRQVSGIEREIEAGTRQVNELGDRLAALQTDYADFVYAEWKNHKKNNATVFLLSAKDFNSATRRLSQLRDYNRARADMGGQIDSLSKRLQADLDTLNAKKTELVGAKSRKDREINSLSQDEKQHNSSLKELQKDRKKLQAKAKKERETIAAAQKEIDRMIASQVKERRGQTSQADIVLSGKFEDNKGLMPWPIGSSATVLDHFGANRMADGIIKESSGLAIAAGRGAEVKALFEGKVSGVFSIGQFDKCISVRSGNYIVVYGNLSTTSLKSGDTVAINQPIGRLSDADNADKHMLLLQIWNGTTPLDPEEWLR